MNEEKDFLDRLDEWVGRGEAFLLVMIAAVMVGLATLQLLLRSILDYGFEWADIIVRHMVLWLGFVGGALATHKSRHIAIDLSQRFLNPRLAAWIRAINTLAAAIICAVLFRASLTFLQDELKSGATLYFGFPSWPLQAIIPVSFVAIAFHFLVSTKTSVLIALGKRSPPPSEGA